MTSEAEAVIFSWLAQPSAGISCTIASADNDFKRFAGVTHVNPLAG